MPHDLKARLDRLAKATSTSTSALAEEALAAYVGEQERQIARIREGLDDDARRVVAHEDCGPLARPPGMRCLRLNSADLVAHGQLRVASQPQIG